MGTMSQESRSWRWILKHYVLVFQTDGCPRPPVAFVFVSNILRLLKFLRLYPGKDMGSAINDIHFKNHVVGRSHHTHIDVLVAMLIRFTGMKNRFQKKRLVCYFGISLSKQRLDTCGVITKDEISPKQPCSWSPKTRLVLLVRPQQQGTVIKWWSELALAPGIELLKFDMGYPSRERILIPPKKEDPWLKSALEYVSSLPRRVPTIAMS